VETGSSDVDTPDKLRDQILRMDSDNKCDRELSALRDSAQNQHQGQNIGLKIKSQQAQGAVSSSGFNPMNPEIALKKLDKQQGHCFNCHIPGNMGKDCPKKATEPSSAPAKKQASYTKRVRNCNTAKPKPTCPTENKSSGVESKCAETEEPACNETKTASKAKDLLEPASSDTYPVWEWCFDNAANVHMASDRRYFTDYTPFDKYADCVRGFKKKFAATPVGHGTVKIVEKRGELEVILILQDVFHVPDNKNLLSHSQAEDQGYAVEYHGRSGDKVYELWKGKDKLLKTGRDKYGLFTFSRTEYFPNEK
ncbi:Copia type Polyprotein, partial [Phytophthora megakarya]